MYLMTRIGKPALKRMEKDKTFVKGLHSTGELDPKRRYIMHFPEELTIMSYGSGYGGNAPACRAPPATFTTSLAHSRRRAARRISRC
jgi:GTP-dependent phosphoenolpyruvate carboxykinase